MGLALKVTVNSTFFTQKVRLFKKKSIISHLYQVFLASIHYILRGKTIDHVTCMKNYQQKYHTEKQECLRSSFSSPDFIKLENRKHTNVNIGFFSLKTF